MNSNLPVLILKISESFSFHSVNSNNLKAELQKNLSKAVGVSSTGGGGGFKIAMKAKTQRMN